MEHTPTAKHLRERARKVADAREAIRAAAAEKAAAAVAARDESAGPE